MLKIEIEIAEKSKETRVNIAQHPYPLVTTTIEHACTTFKL